MPNWVKNIVEITGEEKEINNIVNFLKTENQDFDFNKVIPMPEELDIEDSTDTYKGFKAYNDYVVRCENDGIREEDFLSEHQEVTARQWFLGKRVFLNLKNYGAKTWYYWCVNNWGTKWNANCVYDGPCRSDGKVIYEFDTAWTAPGLIYERLAELFPKVEIIVQFADEGIRSGNCGEWTSEFGEWWPDNETQAIEFACRVWGDTPEENDLFLNEKTGCYEYKED